MPDSSFACPYTPLTPMSDDGFIYRPSSQLRGVRTNDTERQSRDLDDASVALFISCPISIQNIFKRMFLNEQLGNIRRGCFFPPRAVEKR